MRALVVLSLVTAGAMLVVVACGGRISTEGVNGLSSRQTGEPPEEAGARGPEPDASTASPPTSPPPAPAPVPVDPTSADAAASVPTAPVDAGTPSPRRVVFITAPGMFYFTGGNSTWLAQADALCQDEARGAGLTGTFKAWLSSDAQSPALRFVRAGAPYFTADGHPVAADWTALTTGPLGHAIDRTADGGVPGWNETWTGTSPNGQPSGFDCGPTSAATATVGNINATDAAWTASTVGRCDSTRPFYCFEQ